jgi:hypothetical protein
MSRMKCGLNGPVAATPGMIAYQALGTANIIDPLAAKPIPRINATTPRISRYLLSLRRDW